MKYDQITPTRDVVGNSFSNGAIHFRFETSGQKWWVPARSFIRSRIEITKGNTVAKLPITLTDGISPNMGLMSNLFQSAEMRINDKVVSRVSDFLPQVDALETRLTKSKSWVDSVGSATNFWDVSQTKRMNDTTTDGQTDNDNLGSKATSVSLTRTQAGFNVLNTIQYTDSTGLITFGMGGAALPADVRTIYPVGSYFHFAVITGQADFNDPRLRKTARVIAGGSETTLQVDIGSFGSDIATDAGADWRGSTSELVKNTARNVNHFETVWTPPLSLFKLGHAIPGGRFELVLNPQTSSSYQKRAIESILGELSKNPTLPGGTEADYSIRIVDMYLEIATVEGPRADNITYLLDLEQTRCQSEKINTSNFAQKNFDISPSTFAITVAYQDLRAGEHTALSASKFKSYDNTNNGLQPTSSQEELKLNRFFINYAGQNLPAPDASPEFVPQTGANPLEGIDYLTQRYSETQIYSGGYFDGGGAETIQEWKDRGAYYYFSWPRDGTDRSTRVNVHQQFNSASTENMRCLLFDHSKQVARIRIQDGRVVDVQVEDA